MDFDDEFFGEFDRDSAGSSSGFDLSGEKDRIETGLDPFDYRDPVSAYLFRSDDAQAELQDSRTKRMKCLLCGHEFMGRVGDCCPICYGMKLREIR